MGEPLLHCVEEYGLDKLFIELIDHFRRNRVVDHGSKGIGCLGCFLEHYGVLLSFVVWQAGFGFLVECSEPCSPSPMLGLLQNLQDLSSRGIFR